MPAEEAAAQARTLYLNGASLRDVAAATGLTTGAIYAALDAEPRIPRRRAVTGRRAPVSAAGRASTVARLWRTAERQVAEIEQRLAALPGDPAALERDAKTLAIIARTVRDLVALDARQPGEPDRDEHDDLPRDPDAFRLAIARKLEAVLGRGEGA